MSETLEQQLSTAFAAKLGQVSPSIVARVCETDYRPRSRRVPLAPILSLVATAAASCSVAVTLLLSSGATSAFAGWTAKPTALTTAALRQARAACGDVPATGAIVAAEARGPFVAIIYTRDSSPWECLSHGRQVLINTTTLFSPDLFANPGAGKVTLPLMFLHRVYVPQLAAADAHLKHARQLYLHDRSKLRRAQAAIIDHYENALIDANALTAVSGAVGGGVRSVVLVLEDGKRVTATVHQRWYLAWWPGATVHNYPVAVEITTGAGTTTESGAQVRRFLHNEFVGCRPNTRLCPIPPSPGLLTGVAPELRQNFSLFRSTPPASRKVIKVFGGDGSGNRSFSMGADDDQLRAVWVSHLDLAVVTPGTGGVCVTLYSYAYREGTTGGDYVGSGSCEPARAFRAGLFVAARPYAISTLPGYELLGLVPNGNATITVHFKTRRRVKLRVRHNVVFRDFRDEPSSVTYMGAAGHYISQRLVYGS